MQQSQGQIVNAKGGDSTSWVASTSAHDVDRAMAGLLLVSLTCSDAQAIPKRCSAARAFDGVATSTCVDNADLGLVLWCC